MLARAVVPVVLSLLLAGCGAKPASDAADDGAGGPAGLPADAIAAPTWAQGDWWTWSSPQQETPFTYAVSGESATDWIVDTDSQAIAFFDARSDISLLGKVQKSDLAGSQGETRVQFFAFPLTLNKTWTTTWDGQPITIRVLEIADGVATMEAKRADGTVYAKYTYANETSYFGKMQFFNDAGTDVGFASTVTASGHNFSQPLVRWALRTVVDVHGPLPTGQSTTYTVPAGITDVYVEGKVNCTSGAVAIATGPPQGPVDNRGYSVTGQCPILDEAGYVAAGAPDQDETWGLIATSAPSSVGTLDLTLWLRTLLEFPVGHAPTA